MSHDSTDRFSMLELDLDPTPSKPAAKPTASTYTKGPEYMHAADDKGNRRDAGYNNRVGARTIPELVASVPELAATVAKERLYLADGTLVPDINAVVRTYPDGTRQTFARGVGDKYEPVQDARMLDIMSILLDKGLVTNMNGGAYKARAWVYGERTGAKIEVAPGDVLESRALVAHSHDGSLPFCVGWPANAVVCQNTAILAVKNKASRLMKLRHTRNVHSLIQQLESVLEESAAEFLASADKLRLMARTRCDETKLKEYTGYVFSKWADNSDEESEENTSGNRVYSQVLENYHNGTGMDTIAARRGTVWGAYNAMTEYLTHQRGRGDDLARFDSNNFGTGSLLMARAYEGAANLL